MAQHSPDQILTHDYRHLNFVSQLGEDKVLMEAFSGEEALGRPYRYHVRVLTLDPNEMLEKLVGTEVTIVLKPYVHHLKKTHRRPNLDYNKTNYYNGRIVQCRFVGIRSGVVHRGNRMDCPIFELEIRPTFWLLNHFRTDRIFEDKTVDQIILNVLTNGPLSIRVENRLKASYPTLEYCMQYGETHFNFVSRLMEEYGIYYYHRHDNGFHTMVLEDTPVLQKELSSDLVYFPHHGNENDQGEAFADISLEHQTIPKRWMHVHESFKQKDLSSHGYAEYPLDSPAVLGNLNDHHGRFASPDAGNNLAMIRLEEATAEHCVLLGSGCLPGLNAGARFQLKGYSRLALNQAYLVTSYQWNTSNNHFSSQEKSEDPVFEAFLSAIPADIPFRPQRVTPKPRISGAQVAIVVDADDRGSVNSNNEIVVDEFGRVRVKFFWNEFYGEGNDLTSPSCWVRVSHPMAGNGWGFVNHPRIGQEVIVDFLNGDPDCPVITGRLYNSQSMPPYKLPDHKTRSTMKTNTTKGGGGFNEIRFEDKKSEEQIYVHAQKNFDMEVENDSVTQVKNDMHLKVLKDYFEQIDGNFNATVVGSRMVEIKKDENSKVGGNSAHAVDGSCTLKVSGDQGTSVSGNSMYESKQSITLKANANVIVEAMSNITLKVGGSSIAISPSGITLKAPMIMLN